MNWSRSYWDAIWELYWEPSILGLESIGKSQRTVSEEGITIPASRIRTVGSVYTRPRSTVENERRLQGLEVPLNHILDIAFSIAADAVLEACLLEPMAFRDAGPFERLGRDIGARDTASARIFGVLAKPAVHAPRT